MNSLHQEHFFKLESFLLKDFMKGNFVFDPLLALKKNLDGFALGSIKGDVSKHAHLIHPSTITIEKGAIVEPGAYIKGPCYIGKNTVVRHGAYIRGYVVVGSDSIIGHDTEVKHSILLNNVQASHFAYIGDSILGNNVRLGAGVKCANVRLDQKRITLFFNNQKIATNLKKMGCILGDDVQIGCNAVLNPGTIVGPKSCCHPCITVKGIIKPFSVVKGANQIIVESYA
jgi:NDP-sugar pyrophosphorylase family protein